MPKARAPGTRDAQEQPVWHFAAAAGQLQNPETARPPALRTAGTSRAPPASPAAAEAPQGDGGNPAGFQPRPVPSPLSWAVINRSAPTPTRTDG